MIAYNDLRDKTDIERISIAAALYERQEYGECERALSTILDSDPFNSNAISILGAMYIAQDRYGMAELIYRYGLAFFPNLKFMWLGLGTSIRNPERAEECFSYLEKVLEVDPENTVAMTNIASMLNELGEYDKAIEVAEESLKCHIDAKASYVANDTIALAYLGKEKFDPGFRMHQETLGVKFRKEIVYGDEERWNGEKDKTLIIYGEQGIGDEIFYGSCIPDAIEDCKHVIIDCDPKLEGLFKRSFPKASVYGTRRKAAPWLHSHNWDYRCAVGDLPIYYRKTKADFPGTPFLKADPVRAEQWKETFGGKKKIGIALRGGNKFTNRRLRTVPHETFSPLLDYGDLVSLEYTDYDFGDFPVEKYEWATMSEDYDHVAALVSQLDFVVTTCTSIVHLCGGLGIPCYVLRNKYYVWRYAHDMPWYNSVHIIHCDGDWEAGINEVIELIEKEKAA